MADDSDRAQRLDIEENLILKDMLSDIPIVKKEVFNFYDSEFESTPIAVQHENLDEDKKPEIEEEMTPKTLNLPCAVLPNTKKNENNLLRCNKIILGSKPNTVSVDENDQQKSLTPYQLTDVSLPRDQNINRVAVNANYFEELVNCCSEPNVVLQDIQSYLNKSKRFCEVCSILFPAPSGYDNHIQIFHTDKNISETSPENYEKRRIRFKCTICEKTFVAAHVLRRHIKNIHKAKETTVEENTENQIDIQNVIYKDCTDFSNTCFHCKKAFDTQKSLIEHLYDVLQMKRKETEIVPVLKSVLFKCHKCDINFTSSQFAAGHAEHMEMLVNWKCGICNRIFKKEDELSHERQHSVSNNFVVHNLGKIDVSKILFECSKCGVHFSESNFLYHFRDCGLEATKSVHCKICDILLDYNTLHEFDKHADMNNFTIIRTDVISDNPVKTTVKKIQTRTELPELHKSCSEVKVVLQRIDSSKLDVYSNKSGREEIPPDSLNDETLQNINKKKIRQTKLSKNNPNKTGQEYRKNGDIKQDHILDVANGKIYTNANGRRVRRKRSLIYFYCGTCKCFITNVRKGMHKQGLCTKALKNTCKLCGLIFTRNSFMTHKRLHELKKDLQLKNFRFCNLYNGRSMNPPVPEYPECSICAVRFLSKAARQKHHCGKESYLSCPICKTKLSGTVFKLHMAFHQYKKNGGMTQETTIDAPDDESIMPQKEEKNKPIDPKNSTNLQDTLEDVDMQFQNSSLDMDLHDVLNDVVISLQRASSDTDQDDSFDEIDIPLQNPPSNTGLHDPPNEAVSPFQHPLSNTVVRDPLDKIDMPLQHCLLSTEVHDPLAEIDKPLQNSSSDAELHDPFEDFDMTLQNSSDIYEIIYTCGNCSVSVDTYDKAIEHCQEHYINEDKEVITEFCTDCDLQIDKTCYTEHHDLHKLRTQFMVLKFDSYYLPAENDLWIKHIFKTLPNEKVVYILSQSIYRFECRIKMDVVQQGDPVLTVYKCDQCSCFIEPSSLFKHSDNSCFKLRQHPCCHCGLPFNSSTSRTEHEKIHKRPGVTRDSYRIVVFNREKDKHINRSFCLRKSHILYKCRFCDVIIDKLRKDIHHCEFNNVKKCPYCGLLLHSAEYEKHINTHKEFVSFNYSNMKVIILGEDKIFSVPNQKILKSSFKGAIYDYKMYVCNKCEICVKNEKCMPKHTCNFETQRSKCLKCGLYFSVGRLKTHSRSHERDPDLVRSNMNIVCFDPCTLDQNKNTTFKLTEECEQSDSNSDSDSDIVLVNNKSAGENLQSITGTTETIEEIVKIYKCPCALHFLNEDSIFRHFGVCKSKSNISRQNCPKCDLSFTSNILFTHLLAHHSNKSPRFKYDIIEMDNTQISMLQR